MSDEKFLSINEAGEIFFDPEGNPVRNPAYIHEIQQNLTLNENFLLTTEFQDEKYIVESFDHPLQIIALQFKDGKIFLQSNGNNLFEANNEKWSVDAWDRFNGLTTSRAPFVLTDKAQEKLFDMCDSFDDEGFVAEGNYVATPPYYIDTPKIEKANYWEDVYVKEGIPGWDLAAPSPIIVDMLPRLKLPKSRILVLGCGEGHDAAIFAEAGHVVTAVDFSKEGLRRGKEKYGHLPNLFFHELDIFNIPIEWNHSFDLVVEHTCFCAIPPDQRTEMVRLWRRMLHEQGQLLSIFFVMEKRSGPPFGITEWEVRKHLEKHFHFLFWSRWRQSVERRQGRELFVLAKKKV
ncbi:MAG: methyltransferase domain-containing protein [Bdellovibrio sp.]|nr:methyltransferase domain-containing protein [Bdellovibrio sp.]